MKVKATLSAKKLLKRSQKKFMEMIFSFINQAAVVMVAPQCVIPQKSTMVGNSDIKLGEIDGTPFYMNEDQHEKWKHTDLTIDAVKGIGGMFSLDNGTGRRFLTKSEICLVEDDKK